MIKRKEMPSYYQWCDAVIGNLRIGSFEYVELEAVISKKAVINFTNERIKIIFNDKEIDPPFIPKKNDPKTIAQIIDKIVLSNQFREDLLEKEYNFVKNISNPEKAGEWWDSLFEKEVKCHSSISRKSSKISLRIRMLNFLIANRLYYKKLKKIIHDKHDM